MNAFRGTDADLDREIAVVERLVQLRLRRATADLRELEAALAELRRERRRRQRSSAVAVDVPSAADLTA